MAGKVLTHLLEGTRDGTTGLIFDANNFYGKSNRNGSTKEEATAFPG
jgi:hypothetical protein